MKITMTSAALTAATKALQPVMERHTAIEILGHVLIDATTTQINFRVTDLDISLTLPVEGNVLQNGQATVNCKALYDFARTMPETDDVSLEADTESELLSIVADGVDTSLATLPPIDFPLMTTAEYKNTFEIPADHLVQMVDCTAYAISKDEGRYYLHGGYLHAPDVGHGPAPLRLVATDGHRMCYVDQPLPDGAKGMHGVIIPLKTLITLGKLAPTEILKIKCGECRIEIACESFTLESKVVDGTFPDYRRVLPAVSENSFTLDVADLGANANRVLNAASDRSRAIAIRPSKGQVELSCTSNGASAATAISIAAIAGDPPEFGVNGRYLLDVIKKLSGDTVTVSMRSPNDPLKIIDHGAMNVTRVQMPMRL